MPSHSIPLVLPPSPPQAAQRPAPPERSATPPPPPQYGPPHPGGRDEADHGEGEPGQRREPKAAAQVVEEATGVAAESATEGDGQGGDAEIRPECDRVRQSSRHRLFARSRQDDPQ